VHIRQWLWWTCSCLYLIRSMQTTVHHKCQLYKFGNPALLSCIYKKNLTFLFLCTSGKALQLIEICKTYILISAKTAIKGKEHCLFNFTWFPKMFYQIISCTNCKTYIISNSTN
jgi:hypothetical protein